MMREFQTYGRRCGFCAHVLGANELHYCCELGKSISLKDCDVQAVMENVNKFFSGQMVVVKSEFCELFCSTVRQIM